ncbi:MAG: 4Fe-4S binding protein [Methyloversatilis sp.]|uniref:NosR/NirI family protein n=1 Tax=Methyloversatilis sp. TaxID=2569862 RepID=UPI002736014A|nr:NosR/NirI family protein [Methyloversatilis sp.]MDP3872558.1 4Fe-4S binding protein [Methyloversatilis sp.]
MRLAFLSVAVALPATAPALAQTAYEAQLPAALDTAAALCEHVPCAEVVPGATHFSERKGQPRYVEAYVERNGHRELAGYVVLSTDVTDTPAYSGKPVVTLIGLDTRGRFIGVRILKHSEPILLLGIPEAALTAFNRQYLGKFIGDNIEIGHSRPDENIIGLDAISGATVTVIAQNQVMMAAGAAVGRQVGLLEATVRPPAQFLDPGRPLDWATMVSEGLVRRLAVRPEQVGLARAAEPFIELWFGDLNHPAIGRAVLGGDGWAALRQRLGEHDHALFILRTAGRESFKGSGFVRGGLYDRVQVRQGQDAFTFRDLDYLNLYGVRAAGAPAFSESGIFIVRSPAFSAAWPWKLVFLGNRVDRETGARTFANFDAEYWLPDDYLAGGRPAVVQPDAPWVRIWKTRAPQIALFSLLLVTTALVYASRDRLTRRASRKNPWPVNAFKYAAWITSIGFVGFGLLAQPSITQVLTWFHALLFQWTWSLFLSDPFIFLFWIFIIVTVFLWGRGLFCGWLCPFGSLSELIYKVAGAVGLKRIQFSLPKALHDRLKWVKYGVFLGLLAVSMFSMTLAEQLAEIEPFKTTFLVGLFNRSWPYTLFAAGLLGLSIFIERPFCKYLCPLGAALAMPSTFRWFGLRRKQECDRCKACGTGCGSLAIDADGRIDQRECLLCLDCMVMYTDDHACPPLVSERKRRTRAGVEMTPIGTDGYFIPIRPVPPDTPPAN